MNFQVMRAFEMGFGRPEQPPEEYEEEFRDVEDTYVPYIDESGENICIGCPNTDCEDYEFPPEEGIATFPWELILTYACSDNNCYEDHKVYEYYETREKCVENAKEAKRMYNRIGYHLHSAQV